MECKIHGETPFSVDSKGYPRCRKCGVDAVAKRRRNVKLKAIEYKGGSCERCGYDKYPEVLEFHHIDPSKKDFGISHKNYSTSWAKVKVELDKCLMLCANCHRELHVELKRSIAANALG